MITFVTNRKHKVKQVQGVINVVNSDELGEYVSKLVESNEDDILAIDVETTGLDPYRESLLLTAIGNKDDQIVIADETLEGSQESHMNWARKLKNAFFIIFAAYATTMFAMAPLLTAGAGLLKGFALTTMAGITFGVLITRPAFAAMVQILLNEK